MKPGETLDNTLGEGWAGLTDQQEAMRNLAVVEHAIRLMMEAHDRWLKEKAEGKR